MSNREEQEEELVQYGFEAIAEAFEKQKKKLKTRIAQFQYVIDGLIKENNYLKRENEKYHKENTKLKAQYQQIYSTLEVNQTKLSTIQKSILEERSLKGRNKANCPTKKESLFKVPSAKSVCINKDIQRSMSGACLRITANPPLKQDDNVQLHKEHFTRKFFEQCKNELDCEVYKQLMLLFQEFQEGKYEDDYVIHQTNIFLNGHPRLLTLFNNLVE